MRLADLLASSPLPAKPSLAALLAAASPPALRRVAPVGASDGGDPFRVDWKRDPASYTEEEVVARIDAMAAAVEAGGGSRTNFIDPHGFRFWFNWTGPGGLVLAKDDAKSWERQGFRHGREGDALLALTPSVRAALDRYAKAETALRHGRARLLGVDVPAPYSPARRQGVLTVDQQARARAARPVYDDSGKAPPPIEPWQTTVEIDGKHYLCDSASTPRTHHVLLEVVPRAEWSGTVVHRQLARKAADAGLRVGTGSEKGLGVSVHGKEWVCTGRSIEVPSRTLSWDLFDGEVVHNTRTGAWLYVIGHGEIKRNRDYGYHGRQDPGGLWVIDATAKDLSKVEPMFYREMDGLERVGGTFGFYGLMRPQDKQAHIRKWKVPELVRERFMDSPKGRERVAELAVHLRGKVFRS